MLEQGRTAGSRPRDKAEGLGWERGHDDGNNGNNNDDMVPPFQPRDLNVLKRKTMNLSENVPSVATFFRWSFKLRIIPTLSLDSLL